jgi:MoaA/NifB/PqqE/SkfB family radical SAM enzyme
LSYFYHLWLSYGGKYKKCISIITLEVSNVCNLKCPMCGVPYLKRQKGLMTVENFKTIVSKLPQNIKLLKLTYAGEPLLNKDVFSMIRHYRGINASTHIRVSTNGTNLRAFEPREILQSGADQIDIAIEGADAQTHEDYRRGSDFESICNDVRTLCAEKKRLNLNSPKIVQMTLLSKKSLPQIDALKKLAKTLGVDELHLRFMAIPGLGRDGSDLDNSIYDYISNENSKKKWIDEYMTVEPYGLYREKNKKIKIVQEARHCSSFLTPIIYFNGDVSVCCFDGEGSYVFGNLLKEDFESIASKIPAKTIFNRKLPLCRSCVISSKGMNYAEFKAAEL